MGQDWMDRCCHTYLQGTLASWSGSRSFLAKASLLVLSFPGDWSVYSTFLQLIVVDCRLNQIRLVCRYPRHASRLSNITTVNAIKSEGLNSKCLASNIKQVLSLSYTDEIEGQISMA
jgi:hypothetical protein